MPIDTLLREIKEQESLEKKTRTEKPEFLKKDVSRIEYAEYWRGIIESDICCGSRLTWREEKRRAYTEDVAECKQGCRMIYSKKHGVENAYVILPDGDSTCVDCGEDVIMRRVRHAVRRKLRRGGSVIGEVVGGTKISEVPYCSYCEDKPDRTGLSVYRK